MTALAKNGLTRRYFFYYCRYTKPKGQLPDYTAPVVLQTGRTTIESFCDNIHKSIMKQFK